MIHNLSTLQDVLNKVVGYLSKCLLIFLHACSMHYYYLVYFLSLGRVGADSVKDHLPCLDLQTMGLTKFFYYKSSRRL